MILSFFFIIIIINFSLSLFLTVIIFKNKFYTHYYFLKNYQYGNSPPLITSLRTKASYLSFKLYLKKHS
jgi:hypothetical protein